MHLFALFELLTISSGITLAINLGAAAWRRRFKVAIVWSSLGILFSAIFIAAWISFVDPDLSKLFVRVDETRESISIAPLAWLSLCAALSAAIVYKYQGKEQSFNFLLASLTSAPACLALAVVIMAFAAMPVVHY